MPLSVVYSAATEGDPGYYSSAGFNPVTETLALAPFTLNHAEGWLEKSLTDAELTPPKLSSGCLAALDNPAFW